MPHYKCLDCENITDDPSFRTEREYDGLDSPPYRYSTYMVCDNCGGEDFDDIQVCPSCLAAGIMVESETDDGLCDPHHSEELQCMAEEAYDRSIGK